MKLYRSLKSKMLFYILSSTLIIYVIGILYISFQSKKNAFDDAKKLTDSYARENALIIQSYLDSYMQSARILKHILEGKNDIPVSERRSFFMSAMRNVLERNDDFLAVWTIWEPNALDNLDDMYINAPGATWIGNFATTYYKDHGRIMLEQSGTEGELFVGDYYTIPKSTLKETILDAYYYSYTGNEEDAVLQTSVIIPLMQNNLFVGVVGIDAEIEIFQKIVEEIKPYNNSFAFIVGYNGIIVSHPNKNYIGKSITDIYKNYEDQFRIIRDIRNGNNKSFVTENKGAKGNYYFSFAKIEIGQTETPQSLAIVVPINEIRKQANRSFFVTLGIGLICLILISGLIYLIIGNISKPMVKIANVMKKMNQANLEELKSIAKKNRDEIGDIAHSGYTLIKWLNRTGDFAKQIGEGNLESEYELLNNDDILGKSLIEMRDKLIATEKDEEQRQNENKKQRWVSEGLTKFGEILRMHSDDIKEFSYKIVSNLVPYIEANQGGMYVLNKENPSEVHLELTASYAYNRRKYQTKKIIIGEGLIGTCAVEKKRIYMKQIPPEYIEITSGLGESTPSNLLIVPLIANEELFGVIEVASFYVFEDHVIEFVEKVGEIIASTIASVNINLQTAKLLRESKAKSEQLSQQEEEMRQNLEELQATQEELYKNQEETERREKNVVSILEGIPEPILTVDIAGNIEYVNPAFLKFTGYSKEYIKDKNIKFLFRTIEAEDLEIGTKILEATRSDGSKVLTEIKVNKIQKVDGKLYHLFMIRQLQKTAEEK
ncbi:MAG: GAF domain-containing protein [Bacteroidales bacterium]|nr:GAF domain-containing protein [Bacteroidales bacterium]